MKTITLATANSEKQVNECGRKRKVKYLNVNKFHFLDLLDIKVFFLEKPLR